MLESVLIKLKTSKFIKTETPTQIFSCEICETTTSDFPNPAYPFSSLFGKFYPLQYKQSTKLVFFFFNVTISFGQMQPYQLCISKKMFL